MKRRQTYNLKTGVVRSCELRYDMYSFKSAGHTSTALLAFWLYLLSP